METKVTASEVTVATQPAEAADLKTRGEELLGIAKGLRIKTPEHYAKAGEVRTVLIKPFIKQLKAKFAPLKKLASDTHKAICAFEHEILDPAQEADDLYESKMVEWAREEERKRQEKEAKLNARPTETHAPPVTVQSRVPAVPGISTVAKWDYEIMDPNAVPRDYCRPDDDKIAARVDSFGPNANIPGVRVFQKITQAARAR